MNAVERMKATYRLEPVDHLVREEFSIWPGAIEQWQADQGMPREVDRSELFGYDEPAIHQCVFEDKLVPPIKEEVLEATEQYEIVRDDVGRVMKCFKGRRHGFMPQYLQHPVTCDRDWEEDIGPRLSPDTPERWKNWPAYVAESEARHAQGMLMRWYVWGGYMYMRVLAGSVGLCYMFVDNPALVHKMMRAWLDVQDAVAARMQQHVALDEFLLDEDIAYKNGLLISPDMAREFLFPYYEQLLANIRGRQKGRRCYFRLATDGCYDEVIDLYREIGLDVISPVEIAAGNDVVEIATKYPDLAIFGGIDKRALAAGPDAIDAYLGRVIPPMVRRGGYVPTCDHGVPDNVTFASYMHYRKRILELDHA